MMRGHQAGVPTSHVPLWTGRSAMTGATTTPLAHIETAGVRQTRMSHVRDAAPRGTRAAIAAASGTPGRHVSLRGEGP